MIANVDDGELTSDSSSVPSLPRECMGLSCLPVACAELDEVKMGSPEPRKVGQ